MSVSRWVELPRENKIYNILCAGFNPEEQFRLLDFYKDGTGLLRSITSGQKVLINIDYIRYLKGDTTFEDIRKCGKPEPSKVAKVYKLKAESISYEQFKENLKTAIVPEWALKLRAK